PALAAQQAPAEPIDYPDHRVERVKQAPLVRDNAGTESDRRHGQPHLDHEGDYISEVAVLDVERGDPHPDADARRERDDSKTRQEHNLPTGGELVPDHQA